MKTETPKFVWMKRGLEFTQTENNFDVLEGGLPKGIYRPMYDQFKGWYLMNIGDEFTFPYKIYDLQTDFINHVMKTWNNVDRNLGILLNGVKGTGKSVTGKIIANQTGLPVILVEGAGEGQAAQIIEYIKGLNLNCVYFFDEYEKNFEEGGEILTLMDGMYSDRSKKMFILTTNSVQINDNLKSRPSRIRYYMEFSNIDASMISAYLDDSLKDKSKKDEIIKFVDLLKNCTIDIVKAIVEEINLHGCSVEDVQKYMNLSMKEFEYDCYEANDEYDYDYNSTKENARFTFDSFKVAGEKLGKSATIGRSKKRHDFIMGSDLGMDFCVLSLNHSWHDIKIGEYLPRFAGKVAEKDGNYIRIVGSGRNVFVKVKNPDATPSLYGRKL